MPKINYQCEKCLFEISKLYFNLKDIKDNILCDNPGCGGTMNKLMTNPLSHTEFDLGDKYRNKHVVKGINEIMKKRSYEHQKKHELGEQIEKFGKNTMKTTKFFNKDGKIKTDLDEK